MSAIPSKPALSPADYQAFQKFLEEACGIVLGAGKEYLVSSRLTGPMREFSIATYKDLVSTLQRGGNMRLRTAVVDAMTTNETFWFRDMAHFHILTRQILPELKGKRVRIWSAACSSGQEPYNLSMVIQDFRQQNPGMFTQDAEIVATDISQSILADARKGVYCGLAASRGVTPEQRKRYFVANGDCLEVRQEYRRVVSFRELNLAKPYDTLGRFDVIFCRNVLIYFSPEMKRNILSRMARALNPGGYLFLGSTEAPAGLTDHFEMLPMHGGIVYRRIK